MGGRITIWTRIRACEPLGKLFIELEACMLASRHTVSGLMLKANAEQ
jgi:hypothetical protein